MVEDNSGDVGLIRQSLKEHGIGVELDVVSDGEKALKFIDEVEAGRAVCPSLVILDLNLPKTDGREVLQRIRESSLRKVPVAVFSSSGAVEDKQAAARLGADRYIQKPSNLDDFLGIGGIVKILLHEPGA